MTTADLVDDIEVLGGRLLALDPRVAATTFAVLNEKADAALGDKIVRRRLGEGHDKHRQIETIMRRIAARHVVTVKALCSDSQLRHIVHARRHLAHALRHRCHLSYKEVGRAYGVSRQTAMRHAREFAAFKEEKS